MSVDLALMRRDFHQASAWHGWSAEDQAEIGAAIAEAMQAGEPELLAGWAEWLEQMAGRLHLERLVRGLEARTKRRAA